MRVLVQKSKLLKQRFKSRRPKPLLYPASIEIEYRVQLKTLLLAFLKLYEYTVESHLSSIHTEYETNKDACEEDSINKDVWEDIFESVFSTWKSSMETIISRFKPTINMIANKIASWNSKQWDRHLESAVGKNLLITNSNKESLKKVFATKEIEKISKLSNDLYSSLYLASMDNITKSVPINKDLDPFFKKTKLLSALGVSELNTELYKDQQLAMGIDEYIWRTMKDEKVRNSHRPMEGKICSWKDPTIFKYTQDGEWLSKSAIGGVMMHVGEDYNCRCYPEANFYQLI